MLRSLGKKLTPRAWVQQSWLKLMLGLLGIRLEMTERLCGILLKLSSLWSDWWCLGHLELSCMGQA